MKCWECKQEITHAIHIPYVAINAYTGEPYAEKFRDIGYCCCLQIKKLLNSTNHIEVEKLSQRKLYLKKEVSNEPKPA